MKRSEVVNEIICFLEDLKLVNEEATPGDNGYLANSLLQSLEELGMAPPEVKEPVQTHFINQHTGQLVGVEDSSVFVRKWDEE